jgi:DNA-binding MarR family transcriptional regulator
MSDFDRRTWRKGSVYAADYRPLDRNQRAAILFLAEALDRRTHQPGKHGGIIGRSGLAVLRALVTRFLDFKTGRLDPSIASIARAANVARSTAQDAIDRLEIAGILERTRRIARVRFKMWSQAAGRYVMADRVVQQTNAYRLNYALPDRRERGDLGAPLLSRLVSDTGSRSGTNNDLSSKALLEDLPAGGLRDALERLAKSLAPCPAPTAQEG